MNIIHIEDELKGFELVKQLGKGSEGLVEHYRNGLINLAIKTISIDTSKPRQLKTPWDEYNKMKDIKHENIMQYLDIKRSDHGIHLVTEYIEGKDLMKVINQHRNIKKLVP